MAIDSKQLSELWQQFASVLLLLARTRCDLAEDCVQEAFVKLAYQEPIPDDPKAWLVRVVRNAAIDAIRSEKRRKHREHQCMFDQDRWFQSSDPSESSLDQEEVQNALSQLPAEDREIVVAHLWGTMSFRQIAFAFNTTPSTAHRRYQDAIGILRQRLAQQTTTQKLGENS